VEQIGATAVTFGGRDQPKSRDGTSGCSTRDDEARIAAFLATVALVLTPHVVPVEQCVTSQASLV
jgi:hypothetical protein